MVNTFVIGRRLEYIEDLDYQRLGKQRVEAYQIINILEYYDEHGEMPKQGWTDHKVTRMWKGHTKALKCYFNHAVKYWIKLGYENNMNLYENVDCEIIQCTFDGRRAIFEKQANKDTFPIWFSFPPFHFSHRAALYMKNPQEYSYLVDDNVKPYIGRGYLWPSDHGNEIYENWSLDYLAPIAEGIPSYWRIEYSLIEKWINNKNINPKTGRAILPGKKTYKEYEDAAKHHGLI